MKKINSRISLIILGLCVLIFATTLIFLLDNQKLFANMFLIGSFFFAGLVTIFLSFVLYKKMSAFDAVDDSLSSSVTPYFDDFEITKYHAVLTISEENSANASLTQTINGICISESAKLFWYKYAASPYGSVKNLNFETGRLLDKSTVNGAVEVTVEFPKTYLRGQKVDFKANADFDNSFCEEDESFLACKYYQGNTEFKIDIVFPANKPPKDYSLWVVDKTSEGKPAAIRASKDTISRIESNGNVILSASTRDLHINDKLKLKWNW